MGVSRAYEAACSHLPCAQTLQPRPTLNPLGVDQPGAGQVRVPQTHSLQMLGYLRLDPSL